MSRLNGLITIVLLEDLHFIIDILSECFCKLQVVLPVKNIRSLYDKGLLTLVWFYHTVFVYLVIFLLIKF